MQAENTNVLTENTRNQNTEVTVNVDVHEENENSGSISDDSMEADTNSSTGDAKEQTQVD